MSEPDSGSAHRYKIRRSTGKVEFVDRNKLARLQMARAERYRRASQRRRLLALLAGVFVVAVAVLAVIWVWPAGGGDSLLVAGPGAELLPPRPPLRQVEEVPVEGPAARAPSSAPEDVVAAAVRSWARAWSEQDVLGYLAHYSQSFVPADGSERSDWARERRIRVVLPEAVAVELSDLEVELLDGGRARASFLQSYRSPDYSDRVRKTLELAEESGGWRIVAELAATPE